MYCHVALKHFNHDTLTYYCPNPSGYSIGSRVLVPYGQSTKVGILVSFSDDHHLKTVTIKALSQTLDPKPLLSSCYIEFILKMAKYYQLSFNDLIIQSLPKMIFDTHEPIHLGAFVHNSKHQTDFKRLKKIAETPQYWSKLIEHAPISKVNQWLRNGQLIAAQTPETHRHSQLSPLNKQQQSVYDQIIGRPASTHLIWGVTGSGKTEVYTHLAQKYLAENRSILILVPEIALTQQTVQTFETRLGTQATVIHSQLSPKQKMMAWTSAQSIQPSIVIGTRSALFSSIPNLGLIIVDEEHDDSFRQEQTPSFSARDGAVLLGNILNVSVVLGSATPSLESYYNAQNKRYHLYHLSQRYHQTMPQLKIIKLQPHEFIAEKLIGHIQERLQHNEHVMLYIGKRGYSRLLMCHSCGYQLRCSGCDRPITQHHSKTLKCHHCDRVHPPITDCPKCQQAELSPYGAGSQRIEELAKQYWPDYPTIRVDRDQYNASEVSNIIKTLNSQNASILVGTQMLTKGHNIERLNTVVVINADQGLFSSDFRAEEKLFAELIQVSGRCARYQTPGCVFIQTSFPNHPIFGSLDAIPDHYQGMLQQRKAHQLPPVQYLSCIFIYGKANVTTQLARLALPSYKNVMVAGPMIYPAGKRNHIECYQVVVSSDCRVDRDHAFAHIASILKQSTHRTVKIKCQVDSHLSAF